MCLRSNSQFALSNETFRIFKVSKKDSLIKIIRNISSIVFHFQMRDSPMLIILLSEILKSFLPRIRKTLAIVVFLHNISSKETSKVSSISNRQRDLAATPSFLPNIPCESRCDFDQRRVTKRALVNERNQLNKNRTFSL